MNLSFEPELDKYQRKALHRLLWVLGPFDVFEAREDVDIGAVLLHRCEVTAEAVGADTGAACDDPPGRQYGP